METEMRSILENHEKRITELEAKLTGRKVPLLEKDRKTLSDFILELRGEGFFVNPKIPEEVYAELQERYHCEQNRVAVALIRLADRKELRRTSVLVGAKKFKAYVW